MALRIVHLGKYYHPHPGGIETHVRTLAAAQAARGDEVHVVCINHDRRLPEQDWDGPVLVRRFRPRFSVAKLDWLPAVARYLDELNFDVLHLHVPNPTMTLAVLGTRRRTPVVVTYHSDVVGMPLRRLLFGPWDRRIMHRARVIAPTNPRLADASRSLRRHRDRVHVVPLGLDLDRFVRPSPAVLRRAAELRAETAGPRWLMCGRLVPYKGHSVALDALADAPGTLIVVGDGPLRADLERHAARRGVAERVRFLGRVDGDDEVIAHYHAATALWMSSILPSEAFGLVQVEAMACGRPVINTDIPGSGVPWVSRHEETGLTAAPGDAAGFAACARRLAEDSDACARLGEQARERAMRLFDHHRMAESWNGLYEQVLDRTRPPESTAAEAESSADASPAQRG